MKTLELIKQMRETAYEIMRNDKALAEMLYEGADRLEGMFEYEKSFNCSHCLYNKGFRGCEKVRECDIELSQWESRGVRE